MNSVTLPSSRRIAKDSGSGVCGTSPPRMLSSQAIDSGIVSTAAATPVVGERRAEPGALVGSALAGKAVGMRHDRRERGCRPSRPDPVDRIAFNRAQARPGALGAGAQPLDLLRRVQPGVVAEHGALAER